MQPTTKQTTQQAAPHSPRPTASPAHRRHLRPCPRLVRNHPLMSLVHPELLLCLHHVPLSLVRDCRGGTRPESETHRQICFCSSAGSSLTQQLLPTPQTQLGRAHHIVAVPAGGLVGLLLLPRSPVCTGAEPLRNRKRRREHLLRLPTYAQQERVSAACHTERRWVMVLTSSFLVCK